MYEPHPFVFLIGKLRTMQSCLVTNELRSRDTLSYIARYLRQYNKQQRKLFVIATYSLNTTKRTRATSLLIKF